MAKYFVYLIRNGTYLYTGSTGNLPRRNRQHFENFGSSPPEYQEEFATREEALNREKQIKGWTREKKEALIQGREKDLLSLSERRSQIKRKRKSQP